MVIEINVEYWDRISYTSSGSEVKRVEEWSGEKEELFNRFYAENNSLRYCNGSYYKFQDADTQKEYSEWLNSLSEGTRFNMYYGNGVVD